MNLWNRSWNDSFLHRLLAPHFDEAFESNEQFLSYVDRDHVDEDRIWNEETRSATIVYNRSWADQIESMDSVCCIFVFMYISFCSLFFRLYFVLVNVSVGEKYDRAFVLDIMHPFHLLFLVDPYFLTSSIQVWDGRARFNVIEIEEWAQNLYRKPELESDLPLPSEEESDDIPSFERESAPLEHLDASDDIPSFSDVNESS